MSEKLITFCGDFCLAGNITDLITHTTTLNPWKAVLRVMGPHSLVVANLECSVTDAPQGMPFKWANLRMSPQLHGVFDGLSLAVLGNNHIGDFGTEGIADTRALLAAKGVLAVGEGSTLSAALAPAFLDLSGQRLGVVSLCCPTTNSEYLATHLSPGVAPLGMATLRQAIEGSRDHCDALVAFLHWGCEWVHDPAPDQLRLARHAIDCGADAVIGCHSHTIQSYEQYKGRWIFYGLGNFLFNAGEAQAVRADGSIEKIPLTLKPENRESLVVSFKIVPDKAEGRLALDQIQPMRYADDWVPRPIKTDDLTFDLEAANQRLRDYAKRNSHWLQTRHEPEYRAVLRNGILAYWYRDESILQPPAWRRRLKHGRKFFGRVKRGIRNLLMK